MDAGKCLCGGVTWELTAAPYTAYNCHCTMCQKVHGTAFGTYWFFRPGEIRWTGGTDIIAHYRSSPVLTRSACDVCGSVVPYANDKGDHWVAPGGCHENGRKSDCNIFVVDKAPWHEITGDLPRHAVYPEDSGLPSVEFAPPAAAADGIVGGSCLCGAVAFQITEPLQAAYYCHCGRCRRARAAAHAANGFTSFDGVRFIKGEDRLKSYKLPEARYFTQVFCEICSSAMPRRDAGRDLSVVPLGALDEDPGVRPKCHIFVDHKAHWHEITDDLPRFPEGPPD